MSPRPTKKELSHDVHVTIPQHPAGQLHQGYSGSGMGCLASLLVLLCLGAVLAGCSSLERPTRSLPELLQLQQATDAPFTEDSRALVGRVVTRMKAQYDA